VIDYFQLLVHVGYTLMLCALLARDILWLRVILIAAQSVLSVYAFHIGVHSIGGWNAVFVCINAVWVARILRERRAVRLPEELVAIHAQFFAALAAPEFLRLWSWGDEREVDGGMLAEEGLKPSALYFIRAGAVRIEHAGKLVTTLGPGSFVAEMSLLTGEVATADARADGRVRLRSWPVTRLVALRARDAALWTRIQSVLGHDVVEKIRRASTPI
jgi:hypothetical protein